MMDIATERYPLRRGTTALYRALLKLSRRRGANTLQRLHTRWFPGGQRIVHWSGAEMLIPGDPHFFGYVVNHESHISNVIRQVVRPGDTCVDVGANIGYFSTMIAGACGKTGRVFCYEPESQNFSVLEANAKWVADRGLNLIPIHAAVSENEGVVHLELGEFSTLHHIAEVIPPAANSESVPAVNLATDLAKRGVKEFVRLLKIDVEGHEIPVLKGAGAWLASGAVGTVVVEVDPGEHAIQVAQMINEWKAAALIWWDGRWQSGAIEKIGRRTDVRIDFRSGDQSPNHPKATR